MPGGHRSYASDPRGRDVFIVFHLNSPFILLTVLTAHMEHEREEKKKLTLQPNFVTIILLKPNCIKEDIMRDWTGINNGYINKFYTTIHMHRDKTFQLSQSYIKSREREREREQIEVLLQHIQIYPGDVLPNMQDLFMSVSISASHLQTESTASTSQYSQAHNKCNTHTHTHGVRILFFRMLQSPFNPDYMLTPQPKHDVHFQGLEML